MAKKLRERVKAFAFPPFPYKLIVIISSDINASIAKRAVRYGMTPPNDPLMKGCVFGGENTAQSLMFLPSAVNLDTIVHESMHVIWNLFRFTEVPLTSELLAYHMGSLSSDIANFVWERKSRKKAKLPEKIDKLAETP